MYIGTQAEIFQGRGGFLKLGQFVFPKPVHFFDFPKKGRVGLPLPPSYMPDMKDFYSRIME